MPMWISGSSACSGSIMGILSGSIPVGQTGSYDNALSGGICTGSLLVHTYSGSACQRLYIRLSGSGGDEWVFITGSTGCAEWIPGP
jgi:hypothetical protein